jgi:hypothetical protein
LIHLGFGEYSSGGAIMKFIKAAVLAMAVIGVFASPSKAVTYLGNLGSGFDPTAPLGLTLSPGSSIDEDYSLTLTTGSKFSAGLIDITGQISPLEVELWQNAVGVGGSLVASGTGPGVAGFSSYSVTTGGLYFLELIAVDPSGGPSTFVQGEAITSNGGVSSSVPEPGTWALMGIGFVFLGFLAYRRKANQASISFA